MKIKHTKIITVKDNGKVYYILSDGLNEVARFSNKEDAKEWAEVIEKEYNKKYGRSNNG